MKKLLFLVVCLGVLFFLNNPIICEANPDLSELHEVWAVRHDNGLGDSGRCLATDSDNNIAVVGTSNNGVDNDLFLAKYGNTGALLWSLTYSTGLHEAGSRVAIDSNNNIIVAGNIDIDVLSDALVLKYSPNGVLIQYRSA